MSIVSVVDLMLVGVGNMLIIYDIFSTAMWAKYAVGFMFSLISVRSGMNFFVYVSLSDEFRRAFLILVRGVNVNSVATVQVMPLKQSTMTVKVQQQPMDAMKVTTGF